jgi:cysteine-rich repeat protein
MHKRITMTAALFLGAIALAIAGCGHDGNGDGSGGDGGFAQCGNGSIDGGEQCDDGNQADEDACLGTCQRNVCGDGFTNPAAEQCDILVPPTESCRTQGFASGAITCADDCTLDTSACSGQGGPVATPTPTASATPDGGAPTATPTDDGGIATPTATPTPSGGGNACDAGDPVVVVVSIDVAYGAARLDLGYPASDVNIPGSGTAASVVERVVFAASGGLTTVNDDDNIGTLTASLVSFSEQPAGTFASVTFDCVTSVPSASAFVCTVVSASTPGGVSIPDAQCSVSVE